MRTMARVILGLALLALGGWTSRVDAQGESAPPVADRAMPADSGRAAPVDTIRVDGNFAPVVVKLGEPVTLRVFLESPEPGTRLVGPPAPLAVGDLDVLSSTELVTGQDSLGWEITLALFRTGDQTLPALPFRLETPSGPVPVLVRPYTISVTPTVEPDSAATAEIEDIRGPLAPPTRWRPLRVGAALALLVVLILTGWWWWRRRAREGAEVVPVELRLPPDVVAFRDLDGLERDALPARGQVKEHYARVSLIVRTYMERRFRVPAVESTTFEIETALRESRALDRDRAREVLALLDEADLVKFAKFVPSEDAPAAALSGARSWVQATRAMSVSRVEPPASVAGPPEDSDAAATTAARGESA